MSVRPGDQVDLVVDTKAAAEGTAVDFRILAGASDEVARLSGTVSGGAARVTWKVDPGKRPLPLNVTFDASAGGVKLSSGSLTIGARFEIGAAEWVRGGAGGGGSNPFTARSTNVTVDDGQHPQLDVGEQLTLKLTVSVDAATTVQMQFETFDSDHPENPGTLINDPKAKLSPVVVKAGAGQAVQAPWTAAALSDQPMRVRIDLVSGGKVQKTGFSPQVLVFDFFDVTFVDQPKLEPIASEAATREFVSFNATTGRWAATTQTQPPWSFVGARLLDTTKTGSDGQAAVVGAAAVDTGGQARLRAFHDSTASYQPRARRFLPGISPIEFVNVGAPTLPVESTTKVTITTRARVSLWAEPTFLMNSRQDATFNDSRIKVYPDAGGVVDDISFLNLFQAQLDAKGALQITFTQSSAFLTQMVGACHAKKIQCIADFTAIENDGLSGGRFTRLVKTFLAGSKPDIKGAAKAFVDAITPFGFDGIDFDIEDGLVTNWANPIKPNLRLLFAEIAALLAPDNKVLGIATADLVGEGLNGVGGGSIPARGSADALPYDLAFEGSNILIRPMGYDNGIGKHPGNSPAMHKLDPPIAGREASLRDLHTRMCDYALKPISQGGAGLHPGNFQLGVKIFVPFDESDKTDKNPAETGQGGEIRNMPGELQQTCFEVLRPRRVGVIEFSLGAGSDAGSFTNNTALVNAALNASDVTITDWKKTKGAATLPGAVIGQPAQAPHDLDRSLARLKK